MYFVTPHSTSAVYPKLVAPSSILHNDNKRNNLHCVLLNARSVSNKIHDILTELLTIVSPDILFITETWLDCNDVFIIPKNLNYSANIIRCDRKSRGGGVLMCINVNIPFKLVAKMCANDCIVDCLACDVYPTIRVIYHFFNCSRSTRLILVYRSPKEFHQSLDSLIRFIYDNVPNNVHSKFLLLGDFNLPLLANACTRT